MTESEIFFSQNEVWELPKSYKSKFESLLNWYAADSRLIRAFPNIVVTGVSGVNFDAGARKINNTYFVSISEATYLILKDLFMRMLSHPNVFTKIGNAENEEMPTKADLVRDYYTSVDDMVEKGHKDQYKFRVPICSVRKAYALHLLDLAIECIFEHELSHILFGHLNYLQAQQYKLNLAITKNFDLQTLEMDADCTAINRMVWYSITKFNNPEILINSEKPFYQDQCEAITNIFIAIYNCIRLLGNGRYREELLIGQSTHPLPRIRQRMVLAQFERLFNHHLPQLNLVNFKNSLLQKVVESERAYCLITGNTIDKEAFSERYYVNNSLGKDVLENWKDKIRPALTEHTFLPLAE